LARLSKLARQLCIGIAALAASAPAATAVEIHAHRGGALRRGAPVALENSLSAFRSARSRGADVIELDVHVSKDGVPFVMHDGTLDRTTSCTGAVADHTAAQIGRCRIDLLGTNGVFRHVRRAKERVPRLAAVLKWAKSRAIRLNIEINHYPNEPAYDTTSRFVNAELNTIGASHIPKRQILLQSFLPDNITPARRRGYRTALITFSGANGKALALARRGGYPVLEPQWPVPAGLVKRAHAAGRKVIPFTLDTRGAVMAAAGAGVDGIITDDPPMARAALRCFAADRPYRIALRQLAAAQASLRRAHTPAAKGRASARVKAARQRVAKTKRARGRACA
jgi:glycerophosphoryl diester phosphodiesterase